MCCYAEYDVICFKIRGYVSTVQFRNNFSDTYLGAKCHLRLQVHFTTEKEAM